MRRPSPASLHDRQNQLVTARLETEAEVDRLHREEEYLSLQVRQAVEQVRYYEGLLADLKREWGAASDIAQLVRRLG